MKNFSKLLQKGNFTPKERVLLMIADTVSREKEGKEFLTGADITALCGEGWTPKNNFEIREFNRYREGWKTLCSAELDAQTTYLSTLIEYQNMGRYLRDFSLNPIYSEVKEVLNELAKIKRVSAKEAIEIINRQRQEKLKEGYPLTLAIYDLAFELIGKECQKKLLEIYQDIETETSYLEEEQELAGLYQAKDFKTIAERVSKNFYNPHSKEYMSWASYACIPLWEVARRYVKENRLPYKENTEKEDMKLVEARKPTSRDLLISTLVKHAQKKKKTVEEIIKTACLKWIDEGLLEKDHKPLIVCQPELFTKWIESKEKAKEVLQKFIDKGELSTQGKGEELTLTGDSLYHIGTDYKFIREFKERTDFYEPDLGLVKGKGEGENYKDYLDRELLITDEQFFSRYTAFIESARRFFSILSVIEETEKSGEIILDLKKGTLDIKGFFLEIQDKYIKGYESLLAFEDLFKRLSKVYEQDLTYKISKWVIQCEGMIEDYNKTILEALENIEAPIALQDKKKSYRDKKLFIDTKKIKPNGGIAEGYSKEFTNILGEDF